MKIIHQNMALMRDTYETSAKRYQMLEKELQRRQALHVQSSKKGGQ